MCIHKNKISSIVTFFPLLPVNIQRIQCNITDFLQLDVTQGKVRNHAKYLACMVHLLNTIFKSLFNDVLYSKNREAATKYSHSAIETILLVQW